MVDLEAIEDVDKGASILLNILKSGECCACYHDVKFDEAWTVRTSGKAKTYCRSCAADIVKRCRKSSTPHIVTPYVSVHAMNVLRCVK